MQICLKISVRVFEKYTLSDTYGRWGDGQMDRGQETKDRIKKQPYHIFFLGIFLYLGIMLFFPVNLHAKDQKTVRVGYYFSHNFQDGTDDGAPKSGYSYEYLQKLASYTGWKYEYVYGAWSDLFQDLIDGKIDLMAGIAYSEERTRLINYPSAEMLNETFYIYKDEADSSMQCGEISSYKGKKIGIVKNDQRMALALTSWKEDYGADLEIVTFDDFSECASAFNEKKIDGFVSADNAVSSYSGITPVEKIGKQPYYLCTARNRVDLLNELNMAISIVNEQDAMVIDEFNCGISYCAGLP